MVARRFEELMCWQLADALKKEVYALTDRPTVKRHFAFCDQIRSAASSAPSNIAEGFGRFRPGEFAHFLQIAKGSLNETRNHLYDAVDRRLLTADDCETSMTLSQRAIAATTRLIRYLKTCHPSDFDGPIPHTRGPRPPRPRTPRRGNKEPTS